MPKLIGTPTQAIVSMTLSQISQNRNFALPVRVIAAAKLDKKAKDDQPIRTQVKHLEYSSSPLTIRFFTL